MQGEGKKGAVDRVPCRQTEGNVGNAQRGIAANAGNGGNRSQRCLRGKTVGADGQGKRIEQKIFLRKSVFGANGKNFFDNGKPSFCRFGNAVFIQR